MNVFLEIWYLKGIKNLSLFSMATGGGNDEATTQRILRLTDITGEPLKFLAPIGGYEKMPLVSLEEAVKDLVPILPTVQSHAYIAKQNCEKPADGLSQDESASIMLYNQAHQNKEREKISESIDP